MRSNICAECAASKSCNSLTEAYASGQGLYISRTKGSNDNIVKWTLRLKAAWEAALAVRAQTLVRPINQRRPIPIRPEQRFIFLTESGTPLTRAGLDNAWQDLITAAIDPGSRTPKHQRKEGGEEGSNRPKD